MGIRSTYRHPLSGNVYQDRRAGWPTPAHVTPRPALASTIVLSGCAGMLLAYLIVGVALWAR